ncbi:MAG: peptidylprolyl isomerase [Acidobacteriota bacterium]
MRLLDTVPARGSWIAVCALVAASAWPSSSSSPPPPPPPIIVSVPPKVDPPPVREPRAPTAADLARDRKLTRATLVTSEGTLHCRLFADRAPLTVANFVGLATGEQPWRDPETGELRTRPFYDGLTFHRVIPGFIIQGGDPVGNGTGGPGYQLADELDASQAFEPGTLAMANRGPNTAGSQFFIMDGTADWLRGHHTIFGHCDELDVIHRIASVKRSSFDRPVDPVTIEHVTIE